MFVLGYLDFYSVIVDRAHNWCLWFLESDSGSIGVSLDYKNPAHNTGSPSYGKRHIKECMPWEILN